MDPTSADPTDRWLDRLDPVRLIRFLLRPRVRLVAAWAVAIFVAWNSFSIGWNCMNAPARHDGNNGHVNIDFSGQYLLGRMIVEGEGRDLYHRSHQIPVLQKAYAEENEDHSDPAKKSHDWEDQQEWMIGRASTDLGGPLYPPVHALLFAPLTFLPPQLSFRTVQVITFLLTFIVAFLAERITDGRVWCPVALVLVMFLPGYMGALGLGQNPLLTLAMLMVGWWLVTTQRPVLGGVVWGFLAYKPVWAVAFLPVLFLTGRWRAAAAMAVTGAALGLVTLPFVGYDCWLDWLAMGRIASDRYSWDENWLILSRDLINLPRRPFITHTEGHVPIYRIDKWIVDALSYLLWTGVMSISVAVALVRRRQVSGGDGPGPAFLLLAGWMSCLHFMYYDVMLTFLPLCLLFSQPRRFLRVTFWRPPQGPMPAEVRDYYRPSPFAPPPPLPLLPSGRAARWVINPLPPLLLVLLLTVTPLMIWYDPTYHFPPVDTFCVLALWAWCGWAVWKKNVWDTERADTLRQEDQDENPYPVPAEAALAAAKAVVSSVFSPGGAAVNSQGRKPLDPSPPV